MAAVPVKAPRASTETATDIRPIFKLVPVVSPPRTFSKLRLSNALMTATSGQPSATGSTPPATTTSSSPLKTSAKTTRFSLPDSEIAAILADAVAT